MQSDQPHTLHREECARNASVSFRVLLAYLGGHLEPWLLGDRAQAAPRASTCEQHTLPTIAHSPSWATSMARGPA